MPKNNKFSANKKYLLISNFLGIKKRHGGVKRSDQIKELFDNFDCISVNPYSPLKKSIKKALYYPYIFIDILIFSIYFFFKGLSLRGVILFSLKSIEIIRIIKLNKNREIILEGAGDLPIILMNFLAFKNIRFSTFLGNIEYLVPQDNIINYFKSIKYKYSLEIKGYKKANSVFTISEFDSAVLGCHQIKSKTLNYFPCEKDFQQIKEIKKLRDNKSTNKNKGHILLLGTIYNTPTKIGVLDAINYFNKQKKFYPLKVAGFGTEIFKNYSSDCIDIVGSVTEQNLKELIINTKILIINQIETTGFLTKIIDFNLSGVPIICTSNYFQVNNLQKYGIFKVSYSEIPKLLSTNILEKKYEFFEKPII